VKLPFEFGIPLIFRLALPGSLLALLTFRTTQPLFDGFTTVLTPETVLAFQAVFYGWLIVISDIHIYVLFEGRRYWPGWIRRCFVKDERNRLARIRRTIKNGRDWPHKMMTHLSLSQRVDRRRRYLEASVDARAFPINQNNGKSDAELPTRLGNMLLAFEGYSERVYGLDAIFYWARLWQLLDKDLRSELSTAQATTDSALYMSLVFYLGALTNLLTYVLDYYVLDNRTAEISAIGLLGATCLALGYLIYRASLHLHAMFGEQFKSVFDNFGDKIDLKLAKKELASPLAGQSAKEANRIIWRYLHNYRVKDDFRIPKRPSAWKRKYGSMDAPLGAAVAGGRLKRLTHLLARIVRILG
jgi:hypothetical protein